MGLGTWSVQHGFDHMFFPPRLCARLPAVHARQQSFCSLFGYQGTVAATSLTRTSRLTSARDERLPRVQGKRRLQASRADARERPSCAIPARNTGMPRLALECSGFFRPLFLEATCQWLWLAWGGGLLPKAPTTISAWAAHTFRSVAGTSFTVGKPTAGPVS